MFNGIIKNTGKIYRIHKNVRNCSMIISSNLTFLKKDIGSSISCSGACLTLEKYKKNLSTFYISKETINKTNFKYAKKGDIINIEKSLKYGHRISGHFVQGHVDTTSIIKKISIVGKSWLINFKLPKKYRRHIVYKGSITINGISLTISKIFKDCFQIVIIPHTLKLTNLVSLKKDDVVNVEFDVLAKYVHNFFKRSS